MKISNLYMEIVQSLRGNFKHSHFQDFSKGKVVRQIPEMRLEFVIQYTKRCVLTLYILKVIVYDNKKIMVSNCN